MPGVDFEDAACRLATRALDSAQTERTSEPLVLHVHVYHANGEAKFWVEPTVEVAANYGLNAARLNEALKLVEEHGDEIRRAWNDHFPG